LARRPGDVPELARVAALEARLTGAGIVLGPLQALPAEPAERARTLRTLCTALRGIPLLTHGTVGWDPAWATDTPVVLTVPAPSPERQAARWRHALERAAGDGPFDGSISDSADGSISDSADGSISDSDGGSMSDSAGGSATG
ncbi:ATP-binding protein, partial [Streptomyces sp. SID7804]|nr:ATP-binding protein [Streptomyces sp. SID7804]